MPEPLTIRTLPVNTFQVSLPDPCLADPLRPETWLPLVAAREEAQTETLAQAEPQQLPGPMTTAPLAQVGHA